MPHTRLHNEAELLHRIAGGDEKAFSQMYDIYGSKVYAFSLRILQNDVLAEEIVQDVFITLWQYRHLEDIESIHAWLRTLARNKALKLLRRQAVELKAAEELAKEWKEEQNNTELEINYRDMKRILDETLAQLPEQQRKVYLLCHVDGLSYEEAALEMGLSKLTVQTHMKVALRNIRLKLSKSSKLLAFLFVYGVVR